MEMFRGKDQAILLCRGEKKSSFPATNGCIYMLPNACVLIPLTTVCMANLQVQEPLLDIVPFGVFLQVTWNGWRFISPESIMTIEEHL